MIQTTSPSPPQQTLLNVTITPSILKAVQMEFLLLCNGINSGVAGTKILSSLSHRTSTEGDVDKGGEDDDTPIFVSQSQIDLNSNLYNYDGITSNNSNMNYDDNYEGDEIQLKYNYIYSNSCAGELEAPLFGVDKRTYLNKLRIEIENARKLEAKERERHELELEIEIRERLHIQRQVHSQDFGATTVNDNYKDDVSASVNDVRVQPVASISSHQQTEPDTDAEVKVIIDNVDDEDDLISIFNPPKAINRSTTATASTSTSNFENTHDNHDDIDSYNRYKRDEIESINEYASTYDVDELTLFYETNHDDIVRRRKYLKELSKKKGVGMKL